MDWCTWMFKTPVSLLLFTFGGCRCIDDNNKNTITVPVKLRNNFTSRFTKRVHKEISIRGTCTSERGKWKVSVEEDQGVGGQRDGRKQSI